MTLSEVIQKLTSAGIENATQEAKMLFEVFDGRKPYELIASNPNSTNELFLGALKRRLQREPLQYIIGKVPFYHEEYEVSKDCLIPRSDTEVLVEKAIELLPQNAHFIDLCTGSGCIAISVLANRRDLQGDAVDISLPALELAQKNAIRNQVSARIQFQQLDVLHQELPSTYDAILSNPPYIRTPVLKTLEKELSFEPQMALDGGEDGVVFYREILSKNLTHLNPNGFILFEIGYDQEQELRNLATVHHLSIEIFKDYSGNPRLALLRKE